MKQAKKNTRGEAGGRLVPLGLDTTRHDTTRRIKGAKNPSRSSVGLHGAVDAPCCTACLRVLSCKKQGKTAIGGSSKRQQRQEQEQQQQRAANATERESFWSFRTLDGQLSAHIRVFLNAGSLVLITQHQRAGKANNATTSTQREEQQRHRGGQQLRLGHQQLIAWLQTHW